MQLITTAVWLAILPFTIASTCTVSDALSWPPSSSSSTGGSTGGSTGIPSACTDPNGSAVDCCDEASGGDPVELQKCLALAVGKLRARDTLSCTSSETCYQYIDGSLLCLDRSTGLYHDDIGGTGDYNTGEYTAPDGSMTTDVVGAGATPTSSTRRTGSTAVASTTSLSTSSSGKAATTSANDAGSAASATSASVTTSSRAAGAEGLHARAGAGVVGALGLVVGLVL